MAGGGWWILSAGSAVRLYIESEVVGVVGVRGIGGIERYEGAHLQSVHYWQDDGSGGRCCRLRPDRRGPFAFTAEGLKLKTRIP